MAIDARTPAELREGVRSSIRAALAEDVEQRGGRTARRLAAAGAIGVTGTLGTILLLSGHPFDHHSPWHLLVFTAVWAGLLVVSVSLALLGVRTPSLPLARASSIAILGLGIAGVCGALCPDPHFLGWWAGSGPGRWLSDLGGLALGAACFGLLSAVLVGATASMVTFRRARATPIRPLLPAAMLLMLLLPAIALQSVGTSYDVFAGWLLGSAAGSYLGVAGGLRLGATLAGHGSP
jgi:hypothetical protein